MTPNEFKAWFDGFTEAFDRPPTKAQWARIKARVAEIDGKPVTEQVYIDHYWPRYVQYPFYPTYVTQTCNETVLYAGGAVGAAHNTMSADQNYTQAVSANAISNQGAAANFNSLAAMNTLGKADAAAC